MNARSIIAKIGHATSVTLLFVTAGILLFWPLFEKVLPVNDPAQLFGVAIAVLAALMLELVKRVISNQEGAGSIAVRRLSIGGAIQAATAKDKSVGVLRVLASTTETILPALKDCRLRMKECRVIVHDFPSTPTPSFRRSPPRRTGSFEPGQACRSWA
jgi:hypothetical protein